MSGISVCWGRWGRPLPRGLSATEGWSSSRWGSCFSPRDCEGIDLSKYCSCWGSTVAWLWTSQEEEVRTGRKGEGEKRDSRKEDMRLIYCVITGANSASRTFEFCFHSYTHLVPYLWLLSCNVCGFADLMYLIHYYHNIFVTMGNISEYYILYLSVIPTNCSDTSRKEFFFLSQTAHIWKMTGFPK